MVDLKIENNAQRKQIKLLLAIREAVEMQGGSCNCAPIDAHGAKYRCGIHRALDAYDEAMK